MQHFEKALQAFKLSKRIFFDVKLPVCTTKYPIHHPLLLILMNSKIFGITAGNTEQITESTGDGIIFAASPGCKIHRALNARDAWSDLNRIEIITAASAGASPLCKIRRLLDVRESLNDLEPSRKITTASATTSHLCKMRRSLDGCESLNHLDESRKMLAVLPLLGYFSTRGLISFYVYTETLRKAYAEIQKSANEKIVNDLSFNELLFSPCGGTGGRRNPCSGKIGDPCTPPKRPQRRKPKEKKKRCKVPDPCKKNKQKSKKNKKKFSSLDLPSLFGLKEQCSIVEESDSSASPIGISLA